LKLKGKNVRYNPTFWEMPTMKPSSGSAVMAKTSLKPAGGSLVMTVPASVRKALGYTPGTELSVSVDDGKMIIEAVEPTPPARRVRRPKYTLDELLSEACPDAPLSDEERAWQDAGPVGREVW
jgi:antitoxin ChpS